MVREEEHARRPRGRDAVERVFADPRRTVNEELSSAERQEVHRVRPAAQSPSADRYHSSVVASGTNFRHEAGLFAGPTARPRQPQLRKDAMKTRMYRRAGATGPVLGVESGPYTGPSRVVDFDKLPAASRERLLACLRGLA